MAQVATRPSADRSFTLRLLASTLFTAGAALAAGWMACAGIRWSVKPSSSPWSAWIWPYVVYASAAAIWLSLIAIPPASPKHANAGQALLLGIASIIGPLPMLVLSGWMTRPESPWLAVACILSMAAMLAAVVGWSRSAPTSVDWLVRFSLIVWVFVLPSIGLLDMGIRTRNFPIWARLSPLYWLYRVLTHHVAAS